MSMEDFRNFKREYDEKHPLYVQLYENLKQNSDHFKSLEVLWNSAKDNNERDELEKQINALYKQRKETIDRMLRKYEYLHEELTNLRKYMKKFVDTWVSDHP